MQSPGHCFSEPQPQKAVSKISKLSVSGIHMFTIHRNLLAASTLALGVAACTAIFSFVHPLLLDPLAYPKSTELVTIEARDPKGNPLPASLPDFRAWEHETRAFQSIAAFDIGFFFLTDAEEPEQIAGALVTPNVFHLLGVAPVLGRDFAPNEDRTVILTDAAWKRHFAADPDILGSSIALDFARTTEVERYTVIGVLPPNFWMYYAGFEVFVPMQEKNARNLYVVGRRADGVNIGQAQSALRAIPIEKDKTVLVRSWQDTAAQPVRSALVALAAASILLLLIASVNVASLQLSRATARRREIAIRTALGATPSAHSAIAARRIAATRSYRRHSWRAAREGPGDAADKNHPARPKLRAPAPRPRPRQRRLDRARFRRAHRDVRLYRRANSSRRRTPQHRFSQWTKRCDRLPLPAGEKIPGDRRSRALRCAALLRRPASENHGAHREHRYRLPAQKPPRPPPPDSAWRAQREAPS